MKKESYTDHGSLEGKLVYRHGKFYLEEVMFKQLIPIEFNNRLEIYGDVTYSPDGNPQHIKVGKIYIFPENKDIPNFREIQGIFEGHDKIDED